jgi:uncharacterized repeat protein (TIGR03803 family)
MKLAAAAIRGALTLAAFSALLLICNRPAQAQTEKVLYSFGSQSGDATYPAAGLVFDKEGNLYGTTYYGGANNLGTVFEITSAGTEKVLCSFGSQTGDGANPTAGLAFDNKGSLYGTTYYGGANNLGTVFKITSAGTEKVLYSFGSQTGDGNYPEAGLVLDKKGNLYGTTWQGGAYGGQYGGYGTVFEITSAGTERVLYSFCSQPNCTDGIGPYAGLVLHKGNLYGTTVGGGEYSRGTAFEIVLAGKGAGTEKVLYSFGRQLGDAIYPAAGLVFDKKGNLYGTSQEGGLYNWGTVFEITAAGTESVLYHFGSQSGDGYLPYAGLVLHKGNLYGTTQDGGEFNRGTVFEVTAAGTEKVLHSFEGSPGDGFLTQVSLVFDKKGNLYGTTFYGGAYGGEFGYGTVFEVTP